MDDTRLTTALADIEAAQKSARAAAAAYDDARTTLHDLLETLPANGVEGTRVRVAINYLNASVVATSTAIDTAAGAATGLRLLQEASDGI